MKRGLRGRGGRRDACQLPLQKPLNAIIRSKLEKEKQVESSRSNRETLFAGAWRPEGSLLAAPAANTKRGLQEHAGRVFAESTCQQVEICRNRLRFFSFRWEIRHVLYG